MTKKKSLYEVLGVSPNASVLEIRAAHQQNVQRLRAEEGRLSHEDFDFRLKVLNVALDTLTDEMSRADHDAKLVSSNTPANYGKSQNAGGLRTGADSLSRKADALALRAEALALRADAMSIRTDAELLDRDNSSRSFAARLFSSFNSPFMAVILGLGTFAAIGMIVQVGFLYFAANKSENAAVKQEEKIIIQEYYQQYGVRPASAEEARLLEIENQRKEKEQRAEERETQQAERERQRAEEQARRFDEDARRLGEKVSSDLRHAEEMAQREEAQRREQMQEKELRREREEEERLQQARDKWQKRGSAW